MQAVIVAAGKSSRFVPFTTKHKSEIVLLGKPIIQHTIESVKKAGIQKIIIVVGPTSGIPSLLGDGKTYGVDISYVVQPHPDGAGNALLLCQNILDEEFFLLNASHVDFHEFANDMLKKKSPDFSTILLTKKVDSAHAYGVIQVTGEKVTDVVEKPTSQSGLSSRIIGIYFFKKAFLQTLSTAKPEHYQLEAALAHEAKRGLVTFYQTQKDILTLKYAWDLFEIKDYLLNNTKAFIASSASIAKSALLEGNVFVDEGATILEGAIIKGQAYIGKHAFVGTQAFLRNGTILEEKAVAGSKMEIKNSILMAHATTHSGLIEDSIIGEHDKIAGGITTGNVRLDRGEIVVEVKGEKVHTQRKSLGVLIGNNVNCGLKMSTMPGVIIGNDSIIGPETVVMKNIPPFTKYYTKFQEIVEKNNE